MTRTVLLELGFPGGVAQVVRDGRHVLFGLEGDEDLMPYDGEAGAAPAGSERTIACGPAPDAARTAEVRDDAGRHVAAALGGGVWLAVLDQALRLDPPPVVLRHADGSILSPAPPDGWRVRPLQDATTACPACDGTAWDVWRPPDGDDDAVVCRVCGFTLPLSARSSRPPADDDLHPSGALVATSRPVGPDRLHARKALERLLRSTDANGLDVGAPAALRVLHADARERDHRRRAARAAESHVLLAVGDGPRRFTLVTSDDAWGAACRIGDRTITVAALGLEPAAVRLDG